MNRINKKIIFILLVSMFLCTALSGIAYASGLSESDVQATVDSMGKETVTGNIFIWLICAIGFLKVSQRIDSYKSSLGINVGHTGGSLLGDAKVIMKAIRAATGGRLSAISSRGSQSTSASDGNMIEGGLAGVVGRKTTNFAMNSSTGQGGNPITSQMHKASLSSGGDFANDIISKVAQGDVNKNGTISGKKLLMPYLLILVITTNRTRFQHK